jgi:hypothetical protein
MLTRDKTSSRDPAISVNLGKDVTIGTVDNTVNFLQRSMILVVNLLPVSMTSVVKLPPASLTSLVNVEL